MIKNIHFKKLVALSLGIIMLCSCFCVKADYIYDRYTTNYTEEISVANEFISNVINKDSYSDIIELYDTDNVVKYLCFLVEPSGYVIVDVEHDIVLEGGTYDNTFITDVEKDYYYLGPLMYYEKSDDGYVDLCSGNLMEEDAVVEIENYMNNKMEEVYEVQIQENELVGPLSNTEYSVYISGTLPNYSYNPTGICGSTAAAMYLEYLDNYTSTNYVPASLESSNGETLIRALIPYIERTIPGSYPIDVKSGLNWYYSDYGISDSATKATYTSTRFKSVINSNTPVIVDLDSHPTYNDHWVTAYGYYIGTSSTVSYIIVNNGWGSRGVHINPSYINAIVY